MVGKKKIGILGMIFWLICCASNLWQRQLLSEAIWINVPLRGTKCVSEEIHNNVVVLANYYVIADDRSPLDATVSLKVTSPQGNYLHRNDNVTHGQFAFTTSESGSYQACFWVDGYNPKTDVSVNLDWRTGVAAKDWESVARKENIEGVELELRKIEGVVEAVHQNLMYLKNREVQMRSTSEVTNTRVALWSIMSLAVCIATSVMQLLYLKHYFRKKKLL